ncbi:MAG: VCBS repeat-containing protein, partial [Actinomycetia bacterium]|nr:VCBS repeat-containing protein [Actinomycetes bacterium]
MGDVDGDGDLDALIANGRHWPEPNKIFLNSHGRYTTFYQLGDHFSTSYAAEFADMDNDGDLDIIMGDQSPGKLSISLNKHRPTGYFIAPVDTADLYYVQSADLDRDNYLDVVYTGSVESGLYIAYGDPDD